MHVPGSNDHVTGSNDVPGSNDHVYPAPTMYLPNDHVYLALTMCTGSNDHVPTTCAPQRYVLVGFLILRNGHHLLGKDSESRDVTLMTSGTTVTRAGDKWEKLTQM
ncbi:hypothetical protein Hamer_G004676 [Homarus americanus]|uniref:Uncharacterized protein n=1 Tax=Homarus americanus TaxID=6706 RepID=A0A8J5JW16_HOMAM|nr:hypothetical protein Hamer_G004676 [Homarus americanus]